MITKKEMLLSFIIFLSPNGSLKNNMATIIVVVFPLWPMFVALSFLNLPIIISLLTQLLVKLAQHI